MRRGKTEVGLRELKAGLGRYVKRAAAGESITVTDRGRPVAVLVPTPAGVRVLETLRQRGRVRWQGGKPIVTPIITARPNPDLAEAVVRNRQR